MKKIIANAGIFLLLLSLGCQSRTVRETENDAVLVNQLGYYPEAPKYVLITNQGEEFFVENSNGDEVLSGMIPEPQHWEKSGDTISVLDLSGLNDPDEYVLFVDGEVAPFPIKVNAQPFKDLDRSAIRAFYFNRSGMSIDSVFGGKWARSAGHSDTEVVIHSSAASRARPKGTVISSPGGWYDAGDYNKYIVNSGITTFTMLQALHDFPDHFSALECNIPESGNQLPDILDETLYNLRWMLTMQDPNDGGVYHKLTTKNFEGFVMPHEATSQRYVVQKGTAATLDFAAVCAKAVRVLKPWEDQLAGVIDSCRRQAVYAWQWAMNNPDVEYHQPEDIFTGAYGDSDLEDEWFWAACELYLTQGDDVYREYVLNKYQEPSVPGWGNVGMLGTISLLEADEELRSGLDGLDPEIDLFDLVDILVAKWENCGIL